MGLHEYERRKDKVGAVNIWVKSHTAAVGLQVVLVVGHAGSMPFIMNGSHCAMASLASSSRGMATTFSLVYGISANLRATGTGLDFSAASAVVFAELPDEVALVRQAEDRAHRHGQRFPVNVYFLLARGTSDERRRGFPPCQYRPLYY